MGGEAKEERGLAGAGSGSDARQLAQVDAVEVGIEAGGRSAWFSPGGKVLC